MSSDEAIAEVERLVSVTNRIIAEGALSPPLALAVLETHLVNLIKKVTTGEGGN